MNPPIRQCPNGHTICQKCQPSIIWCPTCRREKLAECIGVPCRYRTLGCRGVPPYQSRSGHEANCRFRPYNCPCADSGCLVTFPFSWLTFRVITKPIRKRAPPLATSTYMSFHL